jgi:uncharacterized protein (TIGR02186 family)
MRPLIVSLVLFVVCSFPAFAERLITSISSSRVLITSSYTGAELILFGTIERDVVTVKGPVAPFVVREKQRLGFIWVNSAQQKYTGLPGYLAFHSSRPLSDVTSEQLRERFLIGLSETVFSRGGGGSVLQSAETKKAFNDALIRLKTNAKLFQLNERGVVFLAPNLFRATISLPATAPLGNYEAMVTLFGDGAPLATEKSDFEVLKTGFEARVAVAASNLSALYGLATVLLALSFGWMAHYIFRRD